MALQFIFGNSGSGKSRYLYEQIIRESQVHPEKNYIVLVPEQFTMQTQRELVHLHPSKGILNIDVLSFGRLAHRVFEEVGTDRRTVLTETGKNLMLRKVAIEQKENLQVLGSRMDRPGYVSEVKSVLSELMQYEVGEEALEEMERFSAKRPLLQAKLHDLRCLYQAFLAYQRERFLKPEELLDVLCNAIPRSKQLSKTVLALDGFAGFTPAQIKVIEELLIQCEKVLLTVTIDAKESAFGAIHEHELFAPGRRLVQGVCRAAQQAGRRSPGAGQMEEPVVLGKTELPRFRKDGALRHLEQNLFRSQRESFCGSLEELSMHVSQTPVSEVHFAAQTIAQLVREKGLRYRDIAIITGDLSSYNNYVRKIFPQYHIPAFIDETRRILLNPCLEFVRGALEMCERDFACIPVFRFLRTQMAGITREQIDRLENYVLATGIRGRRRWEQDWDYRVGGISEEELEARNQERRTVMELLGDFPAQMAVRNRTLREYANALVDLMERCDLEEKLRNRAEALQKAGNQEEAEEYEQVYGILIRLLDEMVELLGEEPMEIREFTEILDAGLSEARIGIVPPGIDQVQIGDIRRTRLSNIRVLFFLGLNDGWVPAHGDGGGIVTDMERELLKSTGIELAPSARENSYIQRFYLYQNLTKPREHLYLSWCLGSSDGKEMRPSYLVSVIRRLFPALQVCETLPVGSKLTQITSKESGMDYFLNGLQQSREGETDPEWETLYSFYRQDPKYRSRVQALMRAALQDGVAAPLSYHTSRELYGDVMANSVTRLEQFAACAFAHFAIYGLRLKERDLYGVKPTDLGILFHRSLELFSKRLIGSNTDWTELTEQEQNALMERCVDDVTAEYGGDVLHDTARDAYTIIRLKRILCRSAWALHEQLAAGSFRPSGIELSFDDIPELDAVNVRLAEKSRIRLQGRIDRVDTARTDEAVYVKIVDYKSGMTEFNPVSLYYGLQLQLVVYLNAALEMEEKQERQRKVIPAGIFYYHMQDPVLEKEAGMDNEQARQKLLRKLRPDGILNSDEQVLSMLDRNLTGDSLVIPAGRKKDGGLKAASSTATTEQFRILSKYVNRKMASMGEEMLQGKIAPEPYTDGVRSACDYCGYAAVCGFDRKLPGMCRRKLPDLSKSEVWQKLEEACKEEEDDREVDRGTTEGH